MTSFLGSTPVKLQKKTTTSHALVKTNVIDNIKCFRFINNEILWKKHNNNNKTTCLQNYGVHMHFGIYRSAQEKQFLHYNSC